MDEQAISEPLQLMTAALAMLDAAGKRGPAALLQQAIDELSSPGEREAEPSATA